MAECIVVTDKQFYLRISDNKVKRAVIGFERSIECGTRHIQGYVDFNARRGLQRFIKYSPEATGGTLPDTSSLVNYLYYTENNFQVIGDFSRGQRGMEQGRSNRASVPLITKGLLDSSSVPQIKVSTEYAEKHIYYDNITFYLRNFLKCHDLYNEWSHKNYFSGSTRYW